MDAQAQAQVATVRPITGGVGALGGAGGGVRAACSLGACRDAAREVVPFDMPALAEATGSVLSAVLFGALAGSAALPFPRMAFEAAIRRGQVGVERSLAAFAAGFEAAQSGGVAVPAAASIDQHTRAAPRGLDRKST